MAVPRDDWMSVPAKCAGLFELTPPFGRVDYFAFGGMKVGRKGEMNRERERRY
jgi:hypothetical protein